MRPPSAAQSRAVAVAPAPRGFPMVACPESIAGEHRMSITYAQVNNEASPALHQLPACSQQAPYFSTLSRRHVNSFGQTVDPSQMGQETRVHAVSLFLRRSDPLHLGGMHHVHSSAELPQQVVNPTGRTSRFHGDADPTGEVVLEGAFQALRRCGNHAVFDPLALPILDMDVGRLPRDIETAVVHANLPTVTGRDPPFRLQGGAETVIADQLAGWHPS